MVLTKKDIPAGDELLAHIMGRLEAVERELEESKRRPSPFERANDLVMDLNAATSSVKQWAKRRPFLALFSFIIFTSIFSFKTAFFALLVVIFGQLWELRQRRRQFCSRLHMAQQNIDQINREIQAPAPVGPQPPIPAGLQPPVPLNSQNQQHYPNYFHQNFPHHQPNYFQQQQQGCQMPNPNQAAPHCPLFAHAPTNNGY